MDSDNLEDEVEIKIEYNDYLETDPLCEKNINSIQEKDKIEKASDKDVYKDVIEKEVRWYELIDDRGRYLCKFCSLKYSTLQTLRYHVKTKHPDHVNKIKTNNINRKRNSKFKCHICKEQFRDTLNLKTHLLNSHALADIQISCPYCDATFSTENEMSGHLYAQHKKIGTKLVYMCNICGYRTSIKSHYNQHTNTHWGDKNNKCQYCDYATSYKPNLRIHIRIHTKEKVYACDYVNCEYRCTAKSALRSHQLKHYPEQNVLYCDKCSYKTIYRQCLKRHSECHRRNSVRLKL